MAPGEHDCFIQHCKSFTAPVQLAGPCVIGHWRESGLQKNGSKPQLSLHWLCVGRGGGSCTTPLVIVFYPQKNKSYALTMSLGGEGQIKAFVQLHIPMGGTVFVKSKVQGHEARGRKCSLLDRVFFQVGKCFNYYRSTAKTWFACGRAISAM